MLILYQHVLFCPDVLRGQPDILDTQSKLQPARRNRIAPSSCISEEYFIGYTRSTAHARRIPIQKLQVTARQACVMLPHMNKGRRYLSNCCRWATRPLLLAGLASALGCASVREDRFTVQSSALDYLQIVRTHIPEGEDRPQTIRLDLTGSGYLQLTAGRSERVRSGFWQESQSADWSDWRRDYVVLSPARTRTYYQAFVNAGIFDRRPHEEPDENADLVILMAVGNRKNVLFTDAPVYHQLFAEMLSEF